MHARTHVAAVAHMCRSCTHPDTAVAVDDVDQLPCMVFAKDVPVCRRAFALVSVLVRDGGVGVHVRMSEADMDGVWHAEPPIFRVGLRAAVHVHHAVDSWQLLQREFCTGFSRGSFSVLARRVAPAS